MEQDYLISIITPTYNTPDELFRAAFDSVMAQTLDESLIEWVIVVHNSSKEHLGFVRSLCDGHPGIRVLQPETQLAYRDKRMYVQKTAPDQIKPVHVLTDNPAAEKFFRAFAEKEWK